MSAPILPISSPSGADISALLKPGAGISAANAFGSVLSDAMNTVEGTRRNSELAISQFLTGEGGELHDVALAAQRAELAFDMFVQVRNKVVQAYQQVMQMQL